MKKVSVFLTDGFEMVEALVPVDILKRGEVEVQLISMTGNKEVTSSHDIIIKADAVWEELKDEAKKADAYFLPGGMPNSANLADSEDLQAFLTEEARQGKILSAICAAPMAFGKWGLLHEKEAVCYPGFEHFLEGAAISDKRVVRDGQFLTGKGVGVAFELGYELLSLLTGESTAELEKTMIWH